MTASLRSSMTFEKEGSKCNLSSSFSSLNNEIPLSRSRTISVSSSQCSSNGKNGEKPSQRKSTSLPSDTVDYLKAWMMSPQHIAHPYPTEQEKCQIMMDTGIELKQLTNWFVNNRKRYWKPRVEAQLKRKVQATQANLLQTRSCNERKPTPPATTFIPRVSPDHEFSITPSKRPRRSVNYANTVSDCSNSTSSSSNNSDSDEKNQCDIKNVPPLSISFQGHNNNYECLNIEYSNDSVHEIEAVTIHIMKPSKYKKEPTMEDVTIASNVPPECILKTYHDCVIEYDIPHMIHNNQNAVSTTNVLFFRIYLRHSSQNLFNNHELLHLQIQNVRDTAVLKVKKVYLELYRKSMIRINSSTKSNNSNIVQEQGLNHTFLNQPTYTIPQVSSGIKRMLDFTSNNKNTSKRPMYLQEDTKKWRDVCRNAQHFFDEELPTLEEAAHMFGYVKNAVGVDA